MRSLQCMVCNGTQHEIITMYGKYQGDIPEVLTKFINVLHHRVGSKHRNGTQNEIITMYGKYQGDIPEVY